VTFSGVTIWRARNTRRCATSEVTKKRSSLERYQRLFFGQAKVSRGLASLETGEGAAGWECVRIGSGLGRGGECKCHGEPSAQGDIADFRDLFVRGFLVRPENNWAARELAVPEEFVEFWRGDFLLSEVNGG
jgi:hypothetical protein